MNVSRSSWHRGWSVVMLVSVTGCASAPPARSFAELPGRIDVGNRVTVTATDGEAATGRVDTLHAQAVAMWSEGARREFPAERVERITRKKGHVVAGTLIGLGVGAAVGVAGGSSSSDSIGSTPIDGYAAGVSLLVGMALGTAVGAVVGALVKTDRTVYLAPAAQQP